MPRRAARPASGRSPTAGGDAAPRAGRRRRARDWVRAGIMSYGSAPTTAHDIAHWDLRWPAMTLRSELIATQTLRRGDTVGYGSRFTAEADMRIGVVAVGCRRLSAPRQPARRCSSMAALPPVGRVSMDMLTVDLTPVPRRAGHRGHALGQGPGAVLAIDEVAHAAGTIGYELMCALAQRVPVSVD